MHSSPRPPRLPRWLPVAILLAPAFAQASPYTITFVPDVHDADRPALVVDASGVPHLVWHALEASPIVLRYATFDGADWTSEEVDTVQNGVSAPSLALRSGIPVVSDTRGLWTHRYAERTAPGTWTVETTNVHGGGRNAALMIDALGVPHVLFGNSLPSIEAARRVSPASWASNSVMPDMTTWQFGTNGIAADAAGVLHAVFQPLTTQITPRLYYSRKSGSQWGVYEIVSIIDGDAFISLRIGPDGAPTMSAWNGLQGVGMFHRDAPNNWSFEGIDAAGLGPTSLAWDADGRAHVAYVKAGAIWQGIRATDGQWITQAVTTPGGGESDGLPSLALDPNGDASIAFVRLSAREGGGYERALGIAHDVKTLSADPDATTDLRALAIEWVAPQPTRGGGHVALRLAQPANVTLELIAVDGRRVATKPLGLLEAGTRTVAWEPGALSPGVYMLRAVGEKGTFATRRWVAL